VERLSASRASMTASTVGVPPTGWNWS